MRADQIVTGVVAEVAAESIRITSEARGVVEVCAANALVLGEVAVGALLAVVYDGRQPALLIEPPRVLARVVLVYQESEAVMCAVFDASLVSADGRLALNIGPKTRIFTADGAVYRGVLGGQALVVHYAAATRSIPAQTTPLHVIVL